MKLKSKYLFTLMAAVAFCFVSCNDDNTPENPDDSGITENPGDTDGTDRFQGDGPKQGQRYISTFVRIGIAGLCHCSRIFPNGNPRHGCNAKIG